MSRKALSHQEIIDRLREEYSREKVIDFPCIGNLMPYLNAYYGISPFSLEPISRQYHYTDANGLIGIISSGRLWATELRFLNDPLEGRLFAEAILGFMEQKDGGLSEAEKKVISSVRGWIKKPRSEYSTFSVSFCADGDLLSQWRGYGSFGKGYSIGFDFKNEIHPQHANLAKVRYGNHGLKEVALDLLDIFITSSYRDQMHDVWAYVLTSLALTHKDAGYEEERESRIIFTKAEGREHYFPDAAQLKFRSRNGVVIPYVDFKPYPSELHGDGSDKLPIEKIIVGPGLDFEQSRISLEMLLGKFDYQNVEIAPSEISFRP